MRLASFLCGMISPLIGFIWWFQSLADNPHCSYGMPIIMLLIVFTIMAVCGLCGATLLGFAIELERLFAVKSRRSFKFGQFSGGVAVAALASLLWLEIAVPACPLLTR